jgi:nucleoside-diphosphate-sugar epimerase
MRDIVRKDVHMVMHIAAWLRGRPFSNYQRYNIDGTRVLAEASARAGVERFIFTSSIAVYGNHGDVDVDENTTLRHYGDPYGDSKIDGEAMLFEIREKTGLPLIVVRPGMVYGPGSKGWTVRMIHMAQRGLIPLIDGGSGTAYPVYIDNLVDLLVLTATHPDAIGEVFNGVDDGPVSMKQFLGAYMTMAKTTRAIRAPGWLAQLGARIADPFVPGWSVAFLANQLIGHGQVRNGKCKRVLGWSQRVSLEEGLRRSEAWLREEGML